MQEAKAKLTLAGTAVVAVVPSALAPVGIVPAFKVAVPAVLVVRAPVSAVAPSLEVAVSAVLVEFLFPLFGLFAENRRYCILYSGEQR